MVRNLVKGSTMQFGLLAFLIFAIAIVLFRIRPEIWKS